MEWLIGKLVGRVAVYTCAALLGVIVALSVGLAWQLSRLDKEVAAHTATKAKLTTAEADLTRTTMANTTWKATAEKLEADLAHANRENVRVAEEGRAALAAADRKRKAAQAELEAFKEVFSTRSASCRGALEAMEAACPELSDY